MRHISCALIARLIGLSAISFESTAFAQVGEHGMFVDASHEQLSLGAMISMGSGRYRADLRMMNFTLVTRDHYNRDRVNLSATPLITLGALALGGIFGGNDSSSAQNVTTTIIWLPHIVLNSQHYFELTKPSVDSSRQFGASLVLGTKSDYYPDWGEKWDDWFRFSLRTGVEIYLYTPAPDASQGGRRLSLQAGVAWSRDWGSVANRDSDLFDRGRLFIGLSWASEHGD